MTGFSTDLILDPFAREHINLQQIDQYTDHALAKQFQQEHFRGYFQKKITDYVLGKFENIRAQALKEQKSDTPASFRHQAVLFSDVAFCNLISAIFQDTYQIQCTKSMGYYSVEDHFLFPGLTKQEIREFQLSFTWSPENPHIYGRKDLVVPYQSDLSSVVNEDWIKAQNFEGTDVLILAGEQRIGCHSQILALRAPCFAKIFSSGMEESNTRRVEIKTFDPVVVASFFQFIYTRELAPEVKESAQHLIESIAMAHQYEQSNLIKICCFELDKLLQSSEMERDSMKCLVDNAFQYTAFPLLDVYYNYILQNPKALNELPCLVTVDNWEFMHQRACDLDAELITRELQNIRKYSRDIRERYPAL